MRDHVGAGQALAREQAAHEQRGQVDGRRGQRDEVRVAGARRGEERSIHRATDSAAASDPEHLRPPPAPADEDGHAGHGGEERQRAPAAGRWRRTGPTEASPAP